DHLRLDFAATEPGADPLADRLAHRLVLFVAVRDDRPALVLGLAKQLLMQRAHGAPSPVVAMGGGEHGCWIIATQNGSGGQSKLRGRRDIHALSPSVQCDCRGLRLWRQPRTPIRTL